MRIGVISNCWIGRVAGGQHVGDALEGRAITLIEGGETYAFSMTVASRHFSMNLGDKHIAFRGRLWQGQGGGELLDYTLEFTQFVKGQETLEHRRGSTWNGSTHLQSGKPVEIATFLNGSFTVRLETQR